MAQGKVIDPTMLYKVGFASNHTPEKHPEAAAFWNNIIKTAGGMAINYLSNGLARTRNLKATSNTATAAIELDYTKEKNQLIPGMEAKSMEWKKEINDANKILGWAIVGSEKHNKATTAKKHAFSALQNMATGFQSINLRVEDSKERMLKGNVNDGALSDEYDNFTLFGSGEIYGHLAVDNEGNFSVESEVGTGEFEASEFEASGSDPLVSALSMPESGPEIMKTINTPIEDVIIAGKANNSMQKFLQGWKQTALESGEGGKLYSDDKSNLLREQLEDDMSNTGEDGISDDAIRHFVFGGSARDFSTATSERSSVAYQMAIGAGYNPENKEEWNGFMDLLKSADFGKGSKMREAVVEQMVDNLQGYNKSGYKTWEEENPEKVDPSGRTRTPLSEAALLNIQQEKELADRVRADMYKGFSTYGDMGGRNVKRMGNKWIFKNGGTITGSIPIGTENETQLIMDHVVGASPGKYKADRTKFILGYTNKWNPNN